MIPGMEWTRFLDPRLRLSTAMGWAVMIVVTAAAWLAASLAASEAESRARDDAELLLEEHATQVRDAASMTLEMRSLLLQAMALQLAVAGPARSDTAQQILQAARQRFVEFDGLVVANARGRVLDSAGRTSSLRERLSEQGWFAAAAQHPVVSDAAASPQAGERALVMAVPLVPPAPDHEGGPVPAGDSGRVLAVRLPWRWFEAVLERMQERLGHSRELELMLAARDGTVLLGPDDWLGRSIEGPADLTMGGRYVVGRRTRLRLADSLGLGWTVIVRERAELALEPVRAIRHSVFVIVFLAGLCSAALAVVAARMLTRRLQRLAQAAAQVREGTSEALVVPRGSDEVAAIGAVLSELVGHLQAEKRSLQALNTELDQRVAERTSRIERLSSEARMAAVSRERLRLARDLHDTLAHSLMALLTQIRLVRKLRSRLAADELDAELGRAEEVAASGLADARAAITQMRDNSVRETGFGSAVRDLVRRFGQRTGLPVRLQIDAAADGWLDERFEAAFRIVEESLRNIERHAGASAVEVGVQLRRTRPQADNAVITIGDDGCGFDPDGPQVGHFGLRGMREQAALIGAVLHLRSTAGQGTQVELDLAL